MNVLAAPISPVPAGNNSATAALATAEGMLAGRRVLEHGRRISSSLISAVSHELRSPLTVIRAYSSAALDQQRRLTRAEILDFIRLIDDSAKHVEMLVSDLQTLSEVENARLLVRTAAVCPASLLREALPNLKALAAGRKLSVEVPDWPLEVLADAGRVRQILSNLVQNAARYSYPAAPITLRLESSSHEAVISVEDAGPGVAEEHITRIFEPFYKVPGQQRAHSTGLGLAICAALTRLQGGRIWAERIAPAGGFKVSFSLPRTQVTALRAG